MAQQPDPWPSFLRRFKALEELVKRLLNASPFAGTGLSVPQAGVVQVDGELVVESGEARSGNYSHGATGWRLRPDGTIEMNDAEIRGGIVGNDALANPTSPAAAYDYTSNFAVTTTMTNLRTKTLPVPTGFSKAAVTLTVRIYAVNNSAGLDYLYSQANINGYNGLSLPVAATNAGGSCMNVSTFSAVLEDAALGSSLVLQVAGATAFGTWPTSASSVADLSALVTWYR